MTDVTICNTEFLKGQVRAPASKAYTQRMLIAAMLSKGVSRISDPLSSEDTETTLRAVTALGAKVSLDRSRWTVVGANPIKGAEEPIDCGESGATLRFMIPVSALASEPSVFLLGRGLAKRPLEPLLESLRLLGVQARIQNVRDRAAVWVEGGGIRGGETSMPGDVSSQFVSGLMFACSLGDADTILTLTSPLESSSYVLMTKDVLNKQDVKVDIAEDFSRLCIPAGQIYKPVDGKVPGDFSSAAFLLAASSITKSKVAVDNLNCGTVQGDKAIVRILGQMGAKVKVDADRVEVIGNGGFLDAVDVDAKDIPDLVPVSASLACYAKGTTRIFNAERLRLKESDRLASICEELKKMGANVTVDSGGLTVKGPSKLHGAVIDPHNDHRIAMACAVAALRADGKTVIQNSECVRKSYPQFFTDLRRLGAEVIGRELDR